MFEMQQLQETQNKVIPIMIDRKVVKTTRAIPYYASMSYIYTYLIIYIGNTHCIVRPSHHEQETKSRYHEVGSFIVHICLNSGWSKNI